MAKRLFVRLLLRDDLVFELREADSERLSAAMADQWEFDEVRELGQLHTMGLSQWRSI